MFRRCAALTAVLSLCVSLHAYSLTGYRWATSPITMQLELGSASGTLLDGSTSWGASAEDALNTWNNYISRGKFAVVRNSTAALGSGNGSNNVFFSSDVYGTAWGSGVLAVTLTYYAAGSTSECDVLFNTAWNWNSYRGVLRTNSAGQTIMDFHRVAMHEFGHVLGLDHPDQHGQTVTAIMNSAVSNLDTVAADDISGAQYLYGAAAGSVAAPVFTTQPTSQTVTVGQSVTFGAAVSSAATVSYQWTKAGTAISGATNTSYTIPSAALADAGSYALTATNSGGAVTSSSATLVVNAPVTTTTSSGSTTTTTTPTTSPPPVAPAVVAPIIIVQPYNQTVTQGGSTTFSIVASGTNPLAYVWRRNGSAIASATSGSLALTNVQPADAGTYAVTVTNTAGTATSSSATLTVNAPPAFTLQPTDQTVTAGARVTFSAAATGNPAPTFQWRKDGTDISGATGATLTLDSTQPADAGAYSVRTSNPVATLVSADARLTVLTLPSITQQPAGVAVTAGNAITLTVAATGSPAPTYQWRKDGTDLAGATGATLAIAAAARSDTGSYSVVVRNAAGSIESSVATVGVLWSRLINLSTRAMVPAGGTLTPGFYIRGSTPKRLLIRGIGPTLATFGVATALPGTNLSVIPQGANTVLLYNDQWNGSATLSSLFTRVGAFPLRADSADAAIDASLSAPNAYTAGVSADSAGASGVALAEIYDADSDAAPSRLTNLSTLAFAGGGESGLSAGFVIVGNTAKRLLIRAIGPGLAGFGVSGALPDPQLQLYASGASPALASNDDWSGSATDATQLKAAFAQAGAFALNDGSKDAALVTSLAPGAYTIVITGGANTTGTALFELYDLDP